MAKWYGQIGFFMTVEKPQGSGVWVDEPIVRDYYGDVIRNTSRFQATDKINKDITISNEISIISDDYANQNFPYIKYAEFMGTNWEVTSVDASQYPRLVLSLGGVYHE